MSADALNGGRTGPRPEGLGQVAEAGDDGCPISDQIDLLFRSQAPRLLRFFVRRTAQKEDAADLLQETFLRLTRMACDAVIPASPEAYLQRIATNLVRDRARRAVTHAVDLHEPLDELSTPDPAPGPADVLDAREMLSQYETAMMKLRPRTRQIFLLHRRDGLTYSQIAATASISVSGVEKHMMKAIAHIDRALGRP